MNLYMCYVNYGIGNFSIKSYSNPLRIQSVLFFYSSVKTIIIHLLETDTKTFFWYFFFKNAI